jgi:ABC-type uncharacterized transport system fused permease/ATPase subunit
MAKTARGSQTEQGKRKLFRRQWKQQLVKIKRGFVVVVVEERKWTLWVRTSIICLEGIQTNSTDGHVIERRKI